MRSHGAARGAGAFDRFREGGGEGKAKKKEEAKKRDKERGKAKEGSKKGEKRMQIAPSHLAAVRFVRSHRIAC